MADPQDRPAEESIPRPSEKATPKKAPAKKGAAKKTPAKKAPAKKAPAKKAAPRTAPPTPSPTADPAPHDTPAATPPPIRAVGYPVSPPGPAARSGRYTRVPIAIGLAAASAGAMLLRRLRRG